MGRNFFVRQGKKRRNTGCIPSMFDAAGRKKAGSDGVSGDFEQALRRSAWICEPKSSLARQKSAGILDVFQAFLTMPTAILAARTRTEAIGTASKSLFKISRHTV